MTLYAQFTIYGYIALGLFAFSCLPPHRAFVLYWLGGYLFLPQGVIPLPGVPNLDRTLAMAYGSLLGVLLFSPRPLFRMRLSLWDLPVVGFCLAPGLSAISNSFSLYDIVTFTLNRTLEWAVPYFLARALLTDMKKVRFMILAIIFFGILYLPLCWYEIRMSPQIHRIVFGYRVGWGGYRMGGWRPAVFLDGGLSLGMWMTLVAFSALSMWRVMARGSVFGLPGTIWLVLIPLTTLFCRSLGALLILISGLATITVARSLRNRLALFLFLAIPTFYASRIILDWRPGFVIDFVAEHINLAQAGSFSYRVSFEDKLIDRALERPLLGWGGYGRNRLFATDGAAIKTITDGFWIIEFGKNGLFGLISLLLMHLLPGLSVLRLKRQVFLQGALPLLILSFIPALYMLDYLPNALICPIVMLAAGGAISTSTNILKGRIRARRA